MLKNDFLLLYSYQSELVLNNMARIKNLYLNLLRPELVKKVQTYINSLQLNPNSVYISIHVRRTDYIEWIKVRFKGEPVGPSYFLYGMQHYKKKYENAVFLVTSDDLAWCKENLVNNQTADRLFFPRDYFKSNSEDVNVAIDLIVIAQSNHSSKIL